MTFVRCSVMGWRGVRVNVWIHITIELSVFYYIFKLRFEFAALHSVMYGEHNIMIKWDGKTRVHLL